MNLIDAIIWKIITGIEAKRGKIGAQLVELHLNRVYIPRRAVYLDAIAENPELRLGILSLLWRKSAILGKNRALKKVRK